MKNLIVMAILLMSLSLYARRTGFDAGWKFFQQDVSGAEQPGFNDAGWRLLNLPHDWTIEGSYSELNASGDKCGYLPTGIGWYRKTIAVPKNWKGKHVEIAFDGVYRNSTVWANGKMLGFRPYGWSSFSYDISEVALNGDQITIAVRVDNSQQPAARWYTGSGIYAHTWLDVKEKLHVASNGIFVRTKSNTLQIDTEVENTANSTASFRIKTSIIDRFGKVLKTVESAATLQANQTITIPQTTTVANPGYWSVDEPVLYSAVTEVYAGKTLKDRVTTKFGFRDVAWVPETGVWLNGKNIKLQGVCNHQDAGALGVAVPDKIVRYRIEQLKKMGVNAIRTAHNPQTPVFYNLCDELGMLVMDEIFDGWSKKAEHDYGAHSFAEWWNRDLTDWIKRDRNHPSVVIYSLGNETHGDVAKDMVKRCHELDATRPVTSGHSESQVMDVLGVNGNSEKKGWFETMPTDRVFIGTENTHTWQVRGFYRSKTWYRDGYPNAKQQPYEIADLTEKEIFTNDWIKETERANRKQVFNSSYDNATVRLTSRQNIAQIRDIPNYAGSFRWTGHDYIGEAGYVHGGWPFKAFMGGAIDIANFEKDLYYLYQSQWTSKPMVHILPHWTHPKIKLGTAIPVWVYSNCDEVELFFNGRSLGKKKPGKNWDEMQCQWMVGWQPGELKAIGFKNGKLVSQQLMRTAGAPARIGLSVDGEPLKATGKDVVQVRVTAMDAKGEMYPYGENRTWFHVMGPAKIRALDNGSPVDVEKHFEATNRIAFYGLTRAYVESMDEAGPISLLASCILGEKKQITSDKVSIDAQLLSLRGAAIKPSVKIYYTVDGSLPTIHSAVYKGSFSVPLGSTVKALITLDGKPVQTLEERFAQDEGFVWNEIKEGHGIAGEQAEDASFEGAAVADKGAGFQGKGYVKFEIKAGAFVEWYQENDGGAGDANLYINYSGKADGKAGAYISVTVNGVVVDEKLLLKNTDNWGNSWNKAKTKIKLSRGANTIRLTSTDDSGFYIDEILMD